jgi:hypothetical protein
MYQAHQNQGGGEAPAEEAPASDNVVDAEFEEVDDDQAKRA